MTAEEFPLREAGRGFARETLCTAMQAARNQGPGPACDPCPYREGTRKPLIGMKYVRLVKYSPSQQNARFSRRCAAHLQGSSTELSTDGVDKGFSLSATVTWMTYLWGLSALFGKCHPQAPAGQSDRLPGCHPSPIEVSRLPCPCPFRGCSITCPRTQPARRSLTGSADESG